ncbi:MAG: 5-formyltetrahydrofolate cyclo-ligase, partial [Cyclobacteriaceae bacterium]|nr:5-formyltetrahydrofolate cyclo-ligase [Cyclobacteriaceae bacterium]
MIPGKEYIREKYKKKRAALSDQDKMDLDQKIKVRAIDWLKSGDFPKKVHLFLPIQKQKEVDTFPLLEWFWENGWDVYSS